MHKLKLLSQGLVLAEAGSSGTTGNILGPQNTTTILTGAGAHTPAPPAAAPPTKKPRQDRALTSDVIQGNKMEDLGREDYQNILKRIDEDQWNDIYMEKLTLQDRQASTDDSVGVLLGPCHTKLFK